MECSYFILNTMKLLSKLSLPFIFFTAILTLECAAQDWPNLNRYRDANKAIMEMRKNDSEDARKNWVVFMGNSITQNWASLDPQFFSENDYIGRGISGQTSSQMLLRFRQDVIHLVPKAVVILAGTNDIAGNTGPTSIDMIMDNIKSMTELAQANQIKVVLCSVLPANRYGWSPEVQPADTIIALNELIKDYARSKRLVYVDFYTALVDEQKGLNPNYGRDSVHPNLDGYKVMEPLVVKGIKRALSRP